MASIDNKQYDLILTVLNNPTYTRADLMDVGLNGENTVVQDYEKYINSDKIKNNDLFKDENGKFNEDKFKQFYGMVSMLQNDISNMSFNDAVAAEMQHPETDPFYEPGDKIINPEDYFQEGEFMKDVPIANPDRRKYGVRAFEKSSPNQWTPKELAEMSKRYNPETGEFEESPEGWFTGDNWYSNLFKTTVMATYDKDDPEVLAGRRKEGEYKLNDEGTYYTEFLNGRPIYNKEVISKFDTLTKEGTWLNRYDFFDSDDKDKNPFGVVMRNVATLAPMLIPGVNTYYIAASVGRQMGQVFTNLGKAIIGTENQTLNNIDGWLSQWNMGTSQYAQEHPFSFENFVNMFADVFRQLIEQRWIFETAPKMFLGGKAPKEMMSQSSIQNWKDNFTAKRFDELQKLYKEGDLAAAGEINKVRNLIKSGSDDAMQYMANFEAMQQLKKYQNLYNKIGSISGRSYMTGITAMSAYDEAKQNGASDESAALLAIGYALGEWQILRTGIGEWIMPELRAERQLMKKAINTLAGFEQEALDKATREARNTFAKKAIGFGKDLFDGTFHGKKGMGALAANAVGEGVEEVSEELWYDMAKSLYNVGSWLVGDDFRYNTFDQVLERYSMSMLGGVVGGGVYGYSNMRKQFGQGSELENMKTNQQAAEYIIYMLRDGKKGMINKAIDKMTIKNPNLSDDNVTMDEVSGAINSVKKGSDTSNQNLTAQQRMHELVDYYDNMLKANGLDLSDKELIERNLIENIRYSELSKSVSAANYVRDYNNAIIGLSTAINSRNKLINQIYSGDPNREPTDSMVRKRKAIEGGLTEQEQAQLAAADQAVSDAAMKAAAYVNGENKDQLILKGLYEVSPYLRHMYADSSFGSYVEAVEGKSISELSNERKGELLTQYNEWMQSSGRDKLDVSFKIFMNMLGNMTPVLKQASEGFYGDAANIEAIKTLSDEMKAINGLLTLMTSDSAARGGYAYLMQNMAARNLLTSGLYRTNDNGVDNTNIASSGFSPEVVTQSIYAQVMQDLLGDKNIEETTPEERQELLNKTNPYDLKAIVDKRTSDALVEYGNKLIGTLKKLSNLPNVNQQMKNNIKMLVDSFVNSASKFGDVFDLNNSNTRESIDTISEYIGQLYENGFPANAEPGIYNDELMKEIGYISENGLDKILKDAVNGNLNDNEIEDLANTLIKIANLVAGENNAETIGKYAYVINQLYKLKRGYNDLSDAITDVKSLSEQIYTKKNTPIFEVLDQFGYESEKGHTSGLINAIESLFTSSSGDISNFRLTQPQERDILHLQNVIKHLKAIIYAARNDNASVINPYGFVETANELLGKKESLKGKFVPFDTIDETFAQNMMIELNDLENYLEHMHRLSNMNKSNKLHEHNLMELKLSTLVFNAYNTTIIPMLENAGIDASSLKAIVAENSKLKQASNADSLDGFANDRETMIDATDTILKLEIALHNLTKNGLTEEQMRKMMTRLSPFSQQRSSIDLNSKSLDDVMILWYMASVQGIDPYLRSVMMRKAYEGGDLAPIPLQKFVSSMALSFVVNPNTFNTLGKTWKKVVIGQIKERLDAKKNIVDKSDATDADNPSLMTQLENIGIFAEDIKKTISELKEDQPISEEDKNTLLTYVANSSVFNIFDDVFFIEGIPGAGKTKAVMNIIWRALNAKDDNNTPYVNNLEELKRNIFLVTTPSNVDDLKASADSSIEGPKKVTVMTHEGFLKDAFGISSPEDFNKKSSINLGKDTDYTIHFEGNDTYGGTKPAPSIIFVDEGTLYNQEQVDAIQKMASERNIRVIFFGDEDQMVEATSVSLNVKGGKLNGQTNIAIMISPKQFPHSPKMGMSMRTDNMQMDMSIQAIREAMDYNIRNFNDQKRVQLHYYEDEEVLCGVQMLNPKNLGKDVEDNDEVKRIIDKMLADRKAEVDKLVNDGVPRDVANSRVDKIGLIGFSSLGKRYIGDSVNSVMEANKGYVENDDFIYFPNSRSTVGRELKYYVYYPTTDESNDIGKPLGSKGNNVYDVYHNLYTAVSRSKRFALVLADYGGKVDSRKDNSTTISTYDNQSIQEYLDNYNQITSDVLGRYKDVTVDPIEIKPIDNTLNSTNSANTDATNSAPKPGNNFKDASDILNIGNGAPQPVSEEGENNLPKRIPSDFRYDNDNGPVDSEPIVEIKDGLATIGNKEKNVVVETIVDPDPVASAKGNEEDDTSNTPLNKELEDMNTSYTPEEDGSRNLLYSFAKYEKGDFFNFDGEKVVFTDNTESCNALAFMLSMLYAKKNGKNGYENITAQVKGRDKPFGVMTFSEDFVNDAFKGNDEYDGNNKKKQERIYELILIANTSTHSAMLNSTNTSDVINVVDTELKKLTRSLFGEDMGLDRLDIPGDRSSNIIYKKKAKSTKDNTNGNVNYVHPLFYVQDSDRKNMNELYTVSGRDTRSSEALPNGLYYSIKIGDMIIMEMPFLSFENPLSYFELIKKSINDKELESKMGNLNSDTDNGKEVIDHIAKLINSEELKNDNEKRSMLNHLLKLVRIYKTPNASRYVLNNAQEDAITKSPKTGPLVIRREKGTFYDSEGFLLVPSVKNAKDLSKIPYIHMSNIMMVVNGFGYNNEEGELIKAGTPFVIVTDDVSKRYTDKELMDMFIADYANDGAPDRKRTRIIYLNPPVFSIREYIEKIARIITGKRKNSENDVKNNGLTPLEYAIGNAFSSYRILEKLFQAYGLEKNDFANADTLSAAFKSKASELFGDLSITTDKDTLGSIASVFSKVYGDSDSDTIYKTLFDSGANRDINYLLMTVAYGRHIIDNSFGNELDENKLDIITNKLKEAGYDGIFMYTRRGSNKVMDGVYDIVRNVSEIDGVIPGSLNDKYSFSYTHSDGRVETYEYNIYGDIQPSVIQVSRSDVDGILDSIMSTMGANAANKRTSFDDYKDKTYDRRTVNKFDVNKNAVEAVKEKMEDNKVYTVSEFGLDLGGEKINTIMDKFKEGIKNGNSKSDSLKAALAGDNGVFGVVSDDNIKLFRVDSKDNAAEALSKKQKYTFEYIKDGKTMNVEIDFTNGGNATYVESEKEVPVTDTKDDSSNTGAIDINIGNIRSASVDLSSIKGNKMVDEAKKFLEGIIEIAKDKELSDSGVINGIINILFHDISANESNGNIIINISSRTNVNDKVSARINTLKGCSGNNEFVKEIVDIYNNIKSLKGKDESLMCNVK